MNCPLGQKSGRCGEVTVSEDSTVVGYATKITLLKQNFFPYTYSYASVTNCKQYCQGIFVLF